MNATDTISERPIGGCMVQHRALKRLGKRAKRGFRGYPAGTIACYGTDASRANKLVAAIITGEDEGASTLRRWFSEHGDVRSDPDIAVEVLEFFEEFEVLTVVISPGILGCPHEEGIDYEGPTCPQCPYWAVRDRWTGKLL